MEPTIEQLQARIAELEATLDLAQSALAAIANYAWPGIHQTGLGTCPDWLMHHEHGRHYVELFFEKGEWESIAALRYEVAEVADRMVTEARRKMKAPTPPAEQSAQEGHDR